MKQEDQINALLKQAEFWHELFNGRRNFEWKITLGLWAVILTTISIYITDDYEKHIDWWIFLIPIGLHIFWLRGVWVAHQNDKKRMYHYQNQAESLLINNNHEIEKQPKRISCDELEWWFGFLGDWSMTFQLLTTIGLTILATVIFG